MNQNNLESTPPTGSLSESDKRLNELADKAELLGRGINVSLIRVISPADDEIPDEHASVDTRALAALKESVISIQELIAAIEQEAGIIEMPK